MKLPPIQPKYPIPAYVWREGGDPLKTSIRSDEINQQIFEAGPPKNKCSDNAVNLQACSVDLGGLVVIMLVTGPKAQGFKSGRGRWIFKDDKNS
jgi:hypothetical protein